MDNSLLIVLAVVLVLIPAILGWLSFLRWVINWMLHRNRERLNIRAYLDMIEHHQGQFRPPEHDEGESKVRRLRPRKTGP